MISIITPTYNRSQLIRRMIRSVLQQTFLRWELIIVDDGSTDNTEAVVGEIADKRLRYFRTEHSGAAEKRNMGIELSLYEHIVFLDSDDEVQPEWLQQLWERGICKNASVVCCGQERYNDQGQLLGTVLPRDMGKMFNNLVLSHVSGTMLLKKELVLVAGGFDPHLQSGQHSDFLIRLIPILEERKIKILNIFKPLVKIHEHGGERIRKDPDALYRGCLQIIEKHKSAFLRDENFLHDYLSMAGVNAMRTRRFRKGQSLLFEAFKLKPFRMNSLARLIVAHVPYVRKRVWKL